MNNNFDLLNSNFDSLDKNDILEVNGGMPFLLGVLAASGIAAGTAFVTAGTVYVVGSGVQWIGNKVFK